MDQYRRLQTDKELGRKRLADLRRDFEDVVAASRDTNADDEHDPEGATIAFERSQMGTLINQVEEHLTEIDAALERLTGGRFGICERCGQLIPQARLEARPTARRCVGCG
jgi:DnaK suppressor protein